MKHWAIVGVLLLAVGGWSQAPVQRETYSIEEHSYVGHFTPKGTPIGISCTEAEPTLNTAGFRHCYVLVKD